jgi:hypothetical protein
MKRPALLLLLSLVPAAARAADKTALVEMTNGDRVWCEVKQLKRGQLLIKTDGLGTLYVEWAKVVRLTTPIGQEVRLTSGESYNGPLLPTSREGHLLVDTRAGPLDLPIKDVVSLWPTRSRFWKRIDGSLNLGASYTQSNELLQITPSFAATYIARSHWLNLDTSATLTRQEGEEDSDRANTTVSYVRTFSTQWAAFAQLSGSRNSELGLDWRTDLAGGAGRVLHSTSRSFMFLGAGLAAAREHPRDAESMTNLEALVTAQWQVYTYDFPKTSVVFSFMLYPSLTDSGRVRGDANLTLRRELWHDFTVGLQVYDSFDNRPPTEGAETNDWGATLSVGWTF